jgi:FkbM family methyltransferase
MTWVSLVYYRRLFKSPKSRRQHKVFWLFTATLLLCASLFQVFHVPKQVVVGSNIPVPLTSFGSRDGIWYCDASRLTSDSIVYSFGLGRDTSFDEALITAFPGLRVWGFDPTPKAVAYVRDRLQNNFLDPSHFTLVEEALTGDPNVSTLSFILPPNDPEKVSLRSDSGLKHLRNTVSYQAATLQSFMARFGHDQLDILKIDVEGSEYAVLEQLLTDDFLPAQQFLLEFHLRFFWSNPFLRIRHKRIIQMMEQKGYHLAYCDALQREMTFLRSSAAS